MIIEPSTEREAAPSMKKRVKQVAFVVLLTVAALYLITTAEFSAVRAVYEAY